MAVIPNLVTRLTESAVRAPGLARWGDESDGERPERPEAGHSVPQHRAATRAEKCRRAADHAADPTSRACSRGPHLSDQVMTRDRRLRHVTVGYVGYIPNLGTQR